MDQFTLYQLPNQSHIQMMSYIIKTLNGKLIVIDGGTEHDADYLRSIIMKIGGAVDIWFITHLHSDHINALGQILPYLNGMKINRIVGSFNTPEWHLTNCTELELHHYENFINALADAGQSVKELSLGELFDIDGLKIQVLGVKNPEIHNNALNNSSVVLRIWDAKKSILLLSDLGAEAGFKLLQGEYVDQLLCDYVQMAHHGQKGVALDFYEFVKPSFCLWTTPKWLWNNDDGAGADTGPWETRKVREFMEQLGVAKHYRICDGLVTIT